MASANSEAHLAVRLGLACMNVSMREIDGAWAKSLGITGPQWTILQAVKMLDHDSGVSVKAVADALQVHASFVTTQSKLLEKRGLLHRKTSTTDGRLVHMSLTDKAYKSLAKLADRIRALDDFIFADLNGRQLEELAELLATMRTRLKKAIAKLAIEN
jgi:MarR family transcriptional regulator, organic hydroperoxide resistance regulator